MENRIGGMDMKSQILRGLNNLFLSYPEFAFFAKIVAGVVLLGIVYSIIKLFA
jgi:hypothetical protein